MKQYKLIVHERSFSPEDLIINPRDCPFLKKGDIVEIYHPEDEFSRLLLQVTTLKEDLQGKETISVESSIATAFQLRKFVDVIMSVVDPEPVALDSVELTFRDQYMGRSEMWRLKNSLVNTCVYLNKKIEFCGGYIRCQVYEMWSSGDRVACGVITDNTKIVFRSSTSMVYLFIQMSSEMWDFDIHGDLYFEKAVNGFLADLFQKWKKHGSNHEVTIVLFSRTFYKANNLEEFPLYMRECLQKDYKGRFYEDFYRVAVQNERYDDWSSTLVQLRRLFKDYQKNVLEYHKRPGVEIPKAVNSTAAQGNFLEVLNMSLNVFEKHYLDRSFERTGQLSVVITPGVGVFEVDRQLTNITKQRIIDNGVGSDLVCVGEQPLHAVPLLKFHNKDTSISAIDDYSMPHWINLSFYSTNKKVAYSNFVPRIKLPPRRVRARSQSSQGAGSSTYGEVTLPGTPTTPKSKLPAEEEYFPESPFDYDSYDRQVFQLRPTHTTRFSRQLQRASSRHKKGSVTLDGGVSMSVSGTLIQQHSKLQPRRKTSDPDIHHLNNGEVIGSPTNGQKVVASGGPASPLSPLLGSSPSPSPSPVPLPLPQGDSALTARSAAISIPQTRSSNNSPQPSLSINPNDSKQRVLEGEGETSPPAPCRVVAGSMGSPTSPTPTPTPTSSPHSSALLRPGRALINPFDPSHVTIKLTSNRRRWTHIFPKGPTGVLIQQHHYQAVPTSSALEESHLQSQSVLQSCAHSQEVVSVGSSSPPPPILEITLKMSAKGSMTRSASQIAFQDHVRGRSLGRPNLSGTGVGERASSVLQSSANKALLWGATGEQEWTPALTTGVDWKSLTIPACLPITTDYFPDKRSLQNDYLVSDYNLLPDDVNADFAQRRAIYKKPLTTAEVFRELVSQRLAQGFQLIVPNKESSSAINAAAGTVTDCPATPSSVVGPRTADMDPSEEFLLSIGRIFHRISLKGSCITVTRYRPRHPYPPFNFHYHYRFQAPDHESYEVSWVSFTTEKLENFNWNYLDHYICTRGDTDFSLAEALKYWRFRVYLLPMNHQATKRILDGAEQCDIYVPPTTEDQANMVKNFLRFIETCINRIRRPNTHKKPRELHSFPLAQLTRRRHSTSLTFLSHPSSTTNTTQQSNVAVSSPFRERLGSNRLPEKPRPRSGSKVFERGRASPAGEITSEVPAASSSSDHQDWQDDSQGLVEPRLSRSTPLAEVVDAMRHPSSGVGFLAQHTSLPGMTFVSADAVQWLIRHVEGTANQQAAQVILEKMLSEKLICHASGDFSHPLRIGFYLYHIVQDLDQHKDNEISSAPLGDIQSFENEWLEVEVRHPTHWAVSTEGPSPSPSSPVAQAPPAGAGAGALVQLPKFLEETMEEMCQGDGVARYKNIHLEIDVNNKSDRVEWGHCRYQSLFQAARAYELVVQWVTASGPIAAELILSGWARKAPPSSLQMIPIPGDPLALPFTHKSDPLRGPVFVPLDTECLMGSKSYLFEEFPEDSWPQRLLLFQETIALRFGFIACAMENRGSSAQSNRFNKNKERGREREREQTRHHHQYVHTTGNMFLLIPSPPCPRAHAQAQEMLSLGSGRSKRTGQACRQSAMQYQYPTHHDMVSSPHEEYITRHVSGSNSEDDYGPDRKIGFLWSWNHMLSRRWRWPSLATGDEQFQNKMLRDFREFCSNRENRLLNFWESCWTLREQWKAQHQQQFAEELSSSSSSSASVAVAGPASNGTARDGL